MKGREGREPDVRPDNYDMAFSVLNVRRPQ